MCIKLTLHPVYSVVFWAKAVRPGMTLLKSAAYLNYIFSDRNFKFIDSNFLLQPIERKQARISYTIRVF